MRASALSMIAAVWLLASAAEAQAQPVTDPDEVLAELQDLLLRARFSHTMPAVEALLEREDLTAAQRNGALEVRAVTEIALGQEGADATLARLYRRDPGHRLSNRDLGPSVQAAFARAREKAAEMEGVEVEVGDAQIQADEAGSPFVTVELGGATNAVDSVVLAFREGEGEGGDFTRLTLRRESPSLGQARLPVLGGGVLVHYIEALAPSGATLGSAGSPGSPLVAELPQMERGGPLDLQVASGAAEDDSAGILGQWWFWSAVAVVVGASVGAYFLFGPPSQGPEDGSLGQGALE